MSQDKQRTHQAGTGLSKDGIMYLQAGTGIVAESNREFEQQECANKAKALFRRRRASPALRQRGAPAAVASLALTFSCHPDVAATRLRLLRKLRRV